MLNGNRDSGQKGDNGTLLVPYLDDAHVLHQHPSVAGLNVLNATESERAVRKETVGRC